MANMTRRPSPFLKTQFYERFEANSNTDLSTPIKMIVAVVIMPTLNWTNQCPLFMTVRHIFEISEDDHPSLVTHARDN
jgi:hypothetical protein